MPVKTTNEEDQSYSAISAQNLLMAPCAEPSAPKVASEPAGPEALECNEINAVSARRIFSSRTLAALLTFVAANFVAVDSHHQHPRSITRAVSTNLHSASLTGKPESWWMVKQYLNRDKAPNVVLLGSSQMQCFYTADAARSGHDVDELLDHDCKVLTNQLLNFNGPGSSSPSCFNASLAGSMISDRYLIDKALFTPGKTPRVVVLGIAPRDFIDNTLPSISATEPFQFFTPWLDNAEMEDSAFPSAYDKLSWEVARKLPLRHVADHLLAQQLTLPWIDDAPLEAPLKPTARRSRADQIVVDDKPFFFAKDTTFNVSPGKCRIPHNPFQGFIDNNHEYAMRYKLWNTTEYNQQMRYLDVVLADLSRKNVQTILVGMPLEPTNANLLSENFWLDYSARIKDIATRNGVSFFDLARSSKFEHRDFADGVHLNWRGANKLAALFAQRIESISDKTHLVKRASNSTE